MNLKEKLPVFIVSTMLLLQCILVFYAPDSKLINIISFLSPLLILWMAFSIFRFGKYIGEDLSADDEFGYADKSKDDLGRVLKWIAAILKNSPVKGLLTPDYRLNSRSSPAQVYAL